MAVKTAREIKERYVVDESGKRVEVLLDAEVYKKLVAELESLRTKQVKLRGENGKRRATTRTRKKIAPRDEKNALNERERVIKILKDAGMLAELDPELKRQAAEWRALPEERKRAIIEKLRTIRFDPPLSQTIIEDRG